MKKLLVLIFCLASLSWSQDVRVAHVDTKIIFEKYRKMVEAQAEYDKMLAMWEQKASLIQLEINQLREKLDKKSLTLSDERRRELEAELAQKETEFKEFVDKIYGQEGELVKENARISTPMIQEVREAVNEVALQEGYDLVLDRASGAILFWKNEHDLTDRVLQILNK